MAFDDARTGNSHQVAVSRDFGTWNDAIDVGEINFLAGTDEVRNQEARPSVAGLRK